MKKKCKVVMLPTNDKKAPILSYLNDKSLQYFTNEYWSNPDLTKRHIYILSDEEIKVGDWCYSALLSIFQYLNNSEPTTNCYKIIATTDKSLGLPEPPPGFPSVFVREYNKGNVIENVMVEYEYNKLYPMVQNNNIQLKINKNNYITITKVEDSWNREEVINLLYLFGSRMEDRNDIRPYYRYEEWIEENL